jgi:transcriptional regulator with XRE-family HTH domain
MLSERIRQLRREHGLTQDELAELAGINRSYLSIVENGHSSPTMDVAERLAKALGVSLWTLLSEMEEKHYTYDTPDEFVMYEGLRQFLNDPDEMLLSQPTAEEIEELKRIQFHGGIQPDKRFYRDALLALRRIKREREITG